MKSYAIAFIGIDGWEFTKDAVSSTLFRNPEIEETGNKEGGQIFVIDNGSNNPYPHMDHCQVVRIKRRSYAGAINAAMQLMGDAYWKIITNNDVVCRGSIEDYLEIRDIYSINGEMFHVGFSRKWIDGWFLAIPRPVWREVGRFDENFQYAAFEDADYCFRAMSAGFCLSVSSAVPFKHLETRDRAKLPGFDRARTENLNYLKGKHQLKGDYH